MRIAGNTRDSFVIGVIVDLPCSGTLPMTLRKCRQGANRPCY